MSFRTSFPRLVALLLLPLLAACAAQTGELASASPEARDGATWAFENSDVPVDPKFRFGRLGNGMRYVIRENATPEDTALVRMEFETGSLDENADELGYAHFVEHMAFNGSTRIPEGEMVKLLERNGLAFGADTNASTGFDRTTYRLDLPRNDPELLDTALMLMRETASELTFSSEAVNRERGVVLSELRDRNDYRLRDAVNDAQFLYPEARYPRRFPIGSAETLQKASAEALRTFWAREYVPEHTTLIVVGDFDPALVEAEIVEHFANWQTAGAQAQPDAGPIDTDDGGRTEIYVDPALPERIVASRSGAWLDEPDSVAQRQENLLRRIGYAIVNRRLLHLSRSADPPFRDAGFGTGDIFKAGRSTRLVIDTADGKWRRGLVATAQEYRRALEFGFSPAEIAEQVANIRTSAQNGAAAADTRSHAELVGAVFSLLRDDLVPADPREVLKRFEAFAPRITPERVLAALKREAVPLDDPLLRYRGRIQPEGGESAIRAAWNEAMTLRLERGDARASVPFAYTDFGEPGKIVSDTREASLGIRTIRFANGVMLNLKPTELEKGRVLVKLSIDGGDKLDTREKPLATSMMPYFAEGGLGRHSEDTLQTILAGKTVNNEFSAAEDSFVASSRTTPRDLELQLQVLAAYVTDPGYRSEGEIKFRHQINNYFAQLRATPNSALTAEIGGILSDNDPRFTLQPVEAYRSETFRNLDQSIHDRLRNGAIEIGLVGDFDEDQAIWLVSKTFGALAPRENAFRSYDWQPAKQFTRDRSRRVLRHSGPKDQALLRLSWPTRDDSDPVETLGLELLERVVRLELTETLRETLGKAYSPAASSRLSRHWKGYGTFGIAASIDLRDVAATREALRTTLDKLRREPVGDDELQRARQPLIEAYRQLLRTNGGWLSLVDRTQSEPDRIERFQKAEARLSALTAGDLRQLAQRYLDPDAAVEILVLPEGTDPPAN